MKSKINKEKNYIPQSVNTFVNTSTLLLNLKDTIKLSFYRKNSKLGKIFYLADLIYIYIYQLRNYQKIYNIIKKKLIHIMRNKIYQILSRSLKGTKISSRKIISLLLSNTKYIKASPEINEKIEFIKRELKMNEIYLNHSYLIKLLFHIKRI